MKYYYFQVNVSYVTDKNTNEVLCYLVQATGQDTAKYMAHSRIKLHNSDPKQIKIRQPEITSVELVPSL